MTLTLTEIEKWLDETIVSKSHSLQDKQNIAINTISIDSRTVKPNDLFIAIQGEQFDGHDFIQEAEKKAALAAIVSKEVKTHLPLIKVSDPLIALAEIAKKYRQQYKIPMAAVTGSCGKTSVKEMIACILAAHGPALWNKGNLNTEIGVPLTLLNLNSNHQMAVIEMGARKPGDIRYLMNIANPTVSVITNAGVAHIGIFGSVKGIAETKGEIYAELEASGTAVINMDDPNAPYWQSLLKGQRKITFGFNPSAEVTVTIQQETELGSTFILKTPMGENKIKLSSAGRHSISNAMAAAATALAMGVSLEHIKQGLETFRPVSGRLQIKKGSQDTLIIDDTYNANPVSMKAALMVLKAYPGETIFVMGDMRELGEDALKLHEEMGLEAKKLGITKMLGIGECTLAAVQAFGSGAKHYSDKASLIADLKSLVNPNTVVLVKGSRGMKMEEVVEALLV